MQYDALGIPYQHQSKREFLEDLETLERVPGASTLPQAESA